MYIALLRGINVGGHTVKMEKLRTIFTNMGFTQVRSFIQSGNIFFASDKPKDWILTKIETTLLQELGYEVPVCLKTIDEIKKILDSNPFQDKLLTPESRFSIMFLARPANIPIELPYSTKDGGYEIVASTGNELFIIWHLINGRPGNSYKDIEKMAGGKTTTRFWHTLHKMYQFAIQVKSLNSTIQ